MDANRLVFGRPAPPPALLSLVAGPLTMAFDPEIGAIRYVELPDGTEAVRSIYPTLRLPGWVTVHPSVRDVEVNATEEGFSLSFGLLYEGVDYTASVRVEGSPQGVTYAYEGAAGAAFETFRTGLCVLHPVSLADSPVEIRHPDGTRESGRFPDLVDSQHPFTDVVGVSTKLPGFKVDVTMEGEVFEMEDQRNFGDASFKTYCYPQTRLLPYTVSGVVKQTVRIAAQKWGSPVEGLPPLPEGVAGVMFIDETLPVPLIGLVANESPDPALVGGAPVDYLRMPAASAKDLGVPLELAFASGEGAVEKSLAAANALATPPDRVVVPLSAKGDIDALRLGLDDVLVLASGGILGELNGSDLTHAEADGVAFGFHPQSHLEDDRTLFENLESLPDLAATAVERTEGPVVAGPIRLGPRSDPRTGSLLFAAWLVAALSSLARSDVDAATLFDLEGEDGLFRDGKPIPAYHVLMDLHEFAEGDLIVGVGTARRAAGFALVIDESFRAIVANLTPTLLRIAVVAAGDGPHVVKILDDRALPRAIEDPTGWRAETGETVEPGDGVVEFDLGPYGVARIDAEVDDLETEE